MAHLSNRAINEIGRLLNGKGNPQEADIARLALAACRAAESLTYLSEIDDAKFQGTWAPGVHDYDVVDDGHVRWAASTALSGLDLCIAAGSRLGGFKSSGIGREDSIRTYYRRQSSGVVKDNRSVVRAPWRAWLDQVVQDVNYDRLVRLRNRLVHGAPDLTTHATTGALAGHALRFDYDLEPPAGGVGAKAGRETIGAREVVELSRTLTLTHVQTFVDVLEQLP